MSTKRKRASVNGSSSIKKAKANKQPKFYTPAPSNGTKSMTPARKAKMGEKEELQDLNKRLEFYILTRREREKKLDTYQQKITELKERQDAELENQKALYESQLTNLKTLRQEMSNANDALEDQIRDLESQISELNSDLSAANAKKEAAESRIEFFVEQVKDKSKQLINAEGKNTSLEHELEQSTSEMESVKQQLEKSKTRADQAKAEVASAESKLRNAKEDYAMLESKTSREIEQLKARVEEFGNVTRQQLEDELRTEFGNQLKEFCFDQQKVHKEQLEKGMADLKAQYEGKINEYRDSFEEVSNEADALKSQLRSTETDLKLLQQRPIDEGEKKELERKIVELEQALQQVKEASTAESDQQQGSIRDLRHQLKEKNEDFDALMDVKVALAMEIKSYRLLLDSEEARLGFSNGSSSADSPQRAAASIQDTPVLRRHQPSIPRTPVLRNTPEKKVDFTDTLIVSKLDLEEQYLTVTNESKEWVSLEEWTLSNKDGSESFEFPADLVLKPEESVTVWYGPDAKSRFCFPTDISWVNHGEVVFDLEEGDAALLVDPNGKAVVKIDIEV